MSRDPICFPWVYNYGNSLKHTHTQPQSNCHVQSTVHVFPDRGASLTIRNLKALGRNSGCTWTDDLRELGQHKGTYRYNVVRRLERRNVEMEGAIERILCDNWKGGMLKWKVSLNEYYHVCAVGCGGPLPPSPQN